MIGRRVRTAWGETGQVVQWEPLGAAMCDALVELDGGRSCWFSSSDLRPIDGQGPLPERCQVREVERQRALRQLRVCRADLVARWHEKWPGAEFGKALVGMAIDGAI